MSKIAPTLHAWVRDFASIYADPQLPGVVEEVARARAELSALLSVAKYARIWAATDPWPSSTDARLNTLHRALARLDKVSK